MVETRRSSRLAADTPTPVVTKKTQPRRKSDGNAPKNIDKKKSKTRASDPGPVRHDSDDEHASVPTPTAKGKNTSSDSTSKTPQVKSHFLTDKNWDIKTRSKTGGNASALLESLEPVTRAKKTTQAATTPKNASASTSKGKSKMSVLENVPIKFNPKTMDVEMDDSTEDVSDLSGEELEAIQSLLAEHVVPGNVPTAGKTSKKSIVGSDFDNKSIEPPGGRSLRSSKNKLSETEHGETSKETIKDQVEASQAPTKHVPQGSPDKDAMEVDHDSSSPNTSIDEVTVKPVSQHGGPAPKKRKSDTQAIDVHSPDAKTSDFDELVHKQVASTHTNTLDAVVSPGVARMKIDATKKGSNDISPTAKPVSTPTQALAKPAALHETLNGTTMSHHVSTNSDQAVDTHQAPAEVQAGVEHQAPTKPVPITPKKQDVVSTGASTSTPKSKDKSADHQAVQAAGNASSVTAPTQTKPNMAHRQKSTLSTPAKTPASRASEDIATPEWAESVVAKYLTPERLSSGLATAVLPSIDNATPRGESPEDTDMDPAGDNEKSITYDEVVAAFDNMTELQTSTTQQAVEPNNNMENVMVQSEASTNDEQVAQAMRHATSEPPEDEVDKENAAPVNPLPPVQPRVVVNTDAMDVDTDGTQRDPFTTPVNTGASPSRIGDAEAAEARLGQRLGLTDGTRHSQEPVAIYLDTPGSEHAGTMPPTPARKPLGDVTDQHVQGQHESPFFPESPVAAPSVSETDDQPLSREEMYEQYFPGFINSPPPAPQYELDPIIEFTNDTVGPDSLRDWCESTGLGQPHPSAWGYYAPIPVEPQETTLRQYVGDCRQPPTSFGFNRHSGGTSGMARGSSNPFMGHVQQNQNGMDWESSQASTYNPRMSVHPFATLRDGGLSHVQAGYIPTADFMGQYHFTPEVRAELSRRDHQQGQHQRRERRERRQDRENMDAVVARDADPGEGPSNAVSA